MMYKDIKDSRPGTRTRALRQLWEVEIYDGDPNDPDVGLVVETVIAWNHVDAIRRIGRAVASVPRSLGFVTWSRTGEQHVYLIENTTDGPIEDAPVVPTVGGVGEEDGWDF